MKLYEPPTAIKVSAASARLRFIPCGPTCIALGCKSRCCDAPTHPIGIRVYVSPKQEAGIKKHGVEVVGGFIQPEAGCRTCPFKTEDFLCSLFKKPERPFGCIVSPFALNHTGRTLIIRNRYKLLPCYSPEDGLPAYRTFRSSLVAVFGNSQTSKLTNHLDEGGGDLALEVKDSVLEELRHREQALHTEV